MRVAVTCYSTFFRHQQVYIHKVVCDAWKDMQIDLLREIRSSNQPLIIAGDGRCDSMGHWLVKMTSNDTSVVIVTCSIKTESSNHFLSYTPILSKNYGSD